MRPLARPVGWSVIVACGILGCAKDQCCSSNPNSDDAPQRPPIRLLDLDGRPFDLWSEGRPAIKVVLFTRTDCPISNQYAPEIRRLYDTYQARGVEFYLIYVDPREGSDDIRRHLREYAYPCQGLRDPAHTLVAHCHAATTPEAAVFDKNQAVTYQGRVDDQYADLGQPRAEPTTHDLADAIESTLLGRPVANPRTQAVGCPIVDLKD
jgi:cytochrome oxidase Cu insertion factor (SCO1/SenC/PrrC family)